MNLLEDSVRPADDNPADTIVASKSKGQGLLGLRHEAHRGLHGLDEDTARRVHLHTGTPGVPLAAGSHQVDPQPGVAGIQVISEEPRRTPVLGNDDVEAPIAVHVGHGHAPGDEPPAGEPPGTGTVLRTQLLPLFHMSAGDEI